MLLDTIVGLREKSFIATFFVCFVYLFETGFLCEALEPILELALVDQAGLKLTCLCFQSAGIKGV